MNEIRRRDRSSEAAARIRQIVGRHDAPEFIEGFDLDLGEIEGDPAVWIVFRTRGDLPPDRAAADRWLSEINRLTRAVRDDVIASGEERFPYFRYQSVEPADTGQR